MNADMRWRRSRLPSSAKLIERLSLTGHLTMTSMVVPPMAVLVAAMVGSISVTTIITDAKPKGCEKGSCPRRAGLGSSPADRALQLAVIQPCREDRPQVNDECRGWSPNRARSTRPLRHSSRPAGT
jgi:hypothetical protein